MGKLSNDPFILHFSHHHPLELTSLQQNHSTASCCGCKLPLSGWIYTCRTCTYSLHLPCSQSPHLIHHPSDPNHPLTLLPRPPYPQGYFYCNACAHQGDAFSYHCAACDLDLHLLCASLPLSLFHQAHPHPLNLTFFPPYQNKGFSCDICGDMGSNHWLYRCGLCEFDAHLGCAGDQGPVQVGQQHQRVAMGVPQFHGPGAVYANSWSVGGPQAVRPARNDQGKWLLNLALQGLLGGIPLQAGQAIVQSLSQLGGGGGGVGGANTGGGADGGGDYSYDGGANADGGGNYSYYGGDGSCDW